MTAPMKPWNNSEGQILRSSNLNPVIPQIGGSRNVPLLPPRPGNSPMPMNNYGIGMQSPYSGYGGYGTSSYGSLGYRSPMYGSYGSGYGSYGFGNSYGYGNMGMYGADAYSGLGPRDDTERRFIQFAEESSRNTFANVESVVRVVNSISMMLDNTFFAMTSSFRAVLSVAENFGRLRNMFGHIWYSLNVFRLFRWLYKRLMGLMGYKVMNSAASTAWSEAYNGAAAGAKAGAEGSGGSNWPTIAFFGVLISTPYLISKFLLPKYEDKYNPEKWKTPGVRAKAAFDFVPSSPTELPLRVNDELLLAPTYIQEEMKLTNTGWAFAIGNGKSGLVPLNYVVLAKRVNNGGVLKNTRNYNNNQTIEQEIPIPNNRIFPRNNIKRVSFGDNQIIESNGTERIVKMPDTDCNNGLDDKKTDDQIFSSSNQQEFLDATSPLDVQSNTLEVVEQNPTTSVMPEGGTVSAD